MEILNDAELLLNIKKRFNNKNIFTYVGPTLLVVNPYYKIDELFELKIFQNFQSKISEVSF